MKSMCNDNSIREAHFYISLHIINVTQEKLIKLVSLRGKTVPRNGCRKLHSYLQPELDRAKVKIVRDRLFIVFRDHFPLG